MNDDDQHQSDAEQVAAGTEKVVHVVTSENTVQDNESVDRSDENSIEDHDPVVRQKGYEDWQPVLPYRQRVLMPRFLPVQQRQQQQSPGANKRSFQVGLVANLGSVDVLPPQDRIFLGNRGGTRGIGQQQQYGAPTRRPTRTRYRNRNIIGLRNMMGTMMDKFRRLSAILRSGRRPRPPRIRRPLSQPHQQGSSQYQAPQQQQSNQYQAPSAVQSVDNDYQSPQAPVVQTTATSNQYQRPIVQQTPFQPVVTTSQYRQPSVVQSFPSITSSYNPPTTQATFVPITSTVQTFPTSASSYSISTTTNNNNPFVRTQPVVFSSGPVTTSTQYTSPAIVSSPCFNCNPIQPVSTSYGIISSAPSSSYSTTFSSSQPAVTYDTVSTSSSLPSYIRSTRNVEQRHRDMQDVKSAWYNYYTKMRSYEQKYSEDDELRRFKKEIVAASNSPILASSISNRLEEVPSPQYIEDDSSLVEARHSNIYKERPATLQSYSDYDNVPVVGPGFTQELYPLEIEELLSSKTTPATTAAPKTTKGENNPFTKHNQPSSSPPQYLQTRPRVYKVGPDGDQFLNDQEDETQDLGSLDLSEVGEPFNAAADLISKYQQILTPYQK